MPCSKKKQREEKLVSGSRRQVSIGRNNNTPDTSYLQHRLFYAVDYRVNWPRISPCALLRFPGPRSHDNLPPALPEVAALFCSLICKIVRTQLRRKANGEIIFQINQPPDAVSAYMTQSGERRKQGSLSDLNHSSSIWYSVCDLLMLLGWR
jgi:hypothetical protein